MKWIPITLLVVCSLALASCDDRKAKEKLKATMDRWVGKDVSEFVRKYGPPDRSFSLANGNTFYTYASDRNEVSTTPTVITESPDRPSRPGRPGSTTSVITGGDTIVDRDYCTINVEFDKAGKLLSWSYEGDSPKHCKIKRSLKGLEK